MNNLNSLHLDIANVLIDCAKKRETICYGELCELVNYTRPPVTVGVELEKVSMLTFEHYDGIFLSALVVQSEQKQHGRLLSGDGFFTMYRRECPADTRDAAAIADEQRERIYAQDWSELPDLLRSKIREQEPVTV